MRSLSTTVLLPTAVIIFGILFYFRPGGVKGARPDAISVQGKGFSHEQLTRALAPVVDPSGQVNYGLLRAQPTQLNRYLGQLRAVSPSNAPHRFKTSEDRLAYYINAYNAFMLAAVRDHCPVSNVQEVYAQGGLFWRVSFLMGERAITLSDLESEKIREVVRIDPAARFALVKGARGFMPLNATAYSSKTVRQRLEALKKEAVRSPQFVQIDADRVTLSPFFKWYTLEFGEPLQWLKRVSPETFKTVQKVDFAAFDWRLNGTCAAPEG